MNLEMRIVFGLTFAAPSVFSENSSLSTSTSGPGCVELGMIMPFFPAAREASTKANSKGFLVNLSAWEAVAWWRRKRLEK